MHPLNLKFPNTIANISSGLRSWLKKLFCMYAHGVLKPFKNFLVVILRHVLTYLGVGFVLAYILMVFSLQIGQQKKVGGSIQGIENTCQHYQI